ncbi:TIGR04104 family putative zinc finger protein [Bacillus salacetis]|uniref:TIGR04104 family putative zinc finger protein n=1 Tax=Bacillus salacetis TaxID=2315464 RepID=UPI001443E2C5
MKTLRGILGLQHCRYCKSEFKWKELYQYLWGALYKPFRCTACAKEHFVTIPGRLTNTALTIFPMLIFAQFLSPFKHFLLSIGVGIILGLIGSLISPYLVSLEVDDE